jgi:hypothetical protein
MSTKELIIEELKDLPDEQERELLEIIRAFKHGELKMRSETMLLSEDALADVWLSEEEDEAWKNL